jgi:hypothetical protein
VYCCVIVNDDSGVPEVVEVVLYSLHKRGYVHRVNHAQCSPFVPESHSICYRVSIILDIENLHIAAGSLMSLMKGRTFGDTISLSMLIARSLRRLRSARSAGVMTV